MATKQKLFAPLQILAALVLVASCSHPLEIVGSGDITAVGDGSSCTVEESPCANYIIGEYATTYTAVPRVGFGFLRWDACPAPLFNTCTLAIPKSVVVDHWGATLPALGAVFSPEVPLGNLSGDFAASTDCEGHVYAANPEVVFRFREGTTVAGEQQRQCIGNAIFSDVAAGDPYLVWLDVLHINEANEAIFDTIDGEFPVREIIGNFSDPLLVGRTVTLDGASVPDGSPLSIEITWLDIDAEFNALYGCIVTESRSPITAPLRRKTYCPRFDGSYEIQESLLVESP